MRDILFRGKRIDNGEWICGLPYKAKYGGISAIVNADEERFLIIPETIGQYTGLTDRNGTQIFEGDIVKENGDPEQYCTRYEIRWNEAGFEQKDVELRYGYLLERGSDLEIVGNIHDNSELLPQRRRKDKKMGYESKLFVVEKKQSSK